MIATSDYVPAQALLVSEALAGAVKRASMGDGVGDQSYRRQKLRATDKILNAQITSVQFDCRLY